MPSDGRNNNSEPALNKADYLYNTSTDVSSDDVRTIFENSSDFKSRMLLIRDKPELPVTIAYIDGLVDSKVVSDYILKPLSMEEQFDSCKTEADGIRLISMGKIYSSSLQVRANMKELVDDIIAGNAALIFDGMKTAFTFDSKGEIKRSISEPTGESVIKGAKDSFIEDIRTNTALCRKKIKSPYLSIEEIAVGKQTKTTVAMVYMKNIANEKLVNEVKKRLESIDADRALTTGTVEEFLVDTKYSVFPEIAYTERPDKFCVGLTDGRVGIIIDGMPITYIVPGTLLQFMQTPDEYSYHFIIGTILRLMRFICMFITLVLPGFYVCITTFHPEMLPAELTFSIIASNEGVPFPMFVEVLILLIAFELLLEAGLRLPKTIGQTVSIVGGLVVGQAAVEAKLVSPATVLVIAITAITGFIMPNQDFSNGIRLWRIVNTILSSIIGMFGLTFGLIFLLYHWCRMETFGVPYLDPFVANEDEQFQDTLFRLPHIAMKKRPTSLETKNKKRLE